MAEGRSIANVVKKVVSHQGDIVAAPSGQGRWLAIDRPSGFIAGRRHDDVAVVGVTCAPCCVLDAKNRKQFENKSVSKTRRMAR